MEEDLEFRAEFNLNHQRMFEVQEALDRSTIEDLISYKIKEDKLNHLIVFDDLRVQQIKLANQLRALEDEKGKIDV